MFIHTSTVVRGCIRCWHWRWKCFTFTNSVPHTMASTQWVHWSKREQWTAKISCVENQNLPPLWRILYVEATLDGKYGPTARIYMQHIKRVNNVTTSLIDQSEAQAMIITFTLWQRLLTYSLAPIAKNTQGGCQKHRLDLINISFSHLGLKEMLVDGLFSVCRPSKQFGRVPVDLTLGQIINVDAASRMTYRLHGRD